MNNTTDKAYGNYFVKQATERGFEYRAALKDDIAVTPDPVSREPKISVEAARFQNIKTNNSKESSKVLDR